MQSYDSAYNFDFDSVASEQRWLFIALGPVHTYFVVIENASIDSRPHYRFGAFSTVHTKTFENDRIAHWVLSWTLCTSYKPTCLLFDGPH